VNHDRAETKSADKVAALRVLVHFGLQISDVNRLPVENPTGAVVGIGP
jgi:hypothetical protein